MGVPASLGVLRETCVARLLVTASQITRCTSPPHHTKQHSLHHTHLKLHTNTTRQSKERNLHHAHQNTSLNFEVTKFSGETNPKTTPPSGVSPTVDSWYPAGRTSLTGCPRPRFRVLDPSSVGMEAVVILEVETRRECCGGGGRAGVGRGRGRRGGGESGGGRWFQEGRRVSRLSLRRSSQPVPSRHASVSCLKTHPSQQAQDTHLPRQRHPPWGEILGRREAQAEVSHSYRSTANPFHGFGSHPGLSPIHDVSLESYESKEDGNCPPSYQCVPLVACAPCFDDIRDNYHTCPLSHNAWGVCCPKITPRRSVPSLFAKPSVQVRQMQFSFDVVNEAGRSSLWQLEARDNLERYLQMRNIVIAKPGTPEYAHLQFFRTSPRAMKISRDALTSVGASDYLVTRFRLDPLEAGFGLQQISLRNSIIEDVCPVTPNCGAKEQYYRTSDGSCNNVDRPSLGQARTPLHRLTMPLYSDGLMRPRRSVTGDALPSARLVSTSVSPDADRPNNDLTLYVMLWGQFIDHDLTHVPIFRFDNTSGIECCTNNRRDFLDANLIHPSCFPIEIPADDPFHSRTSGRRCMNFVRSMISPRDCNLGFAEQMNQLTHFLDSSNIYGSSREDEEKVRAFTDGLLKEQGSNLLPANPEAMECFSSSHGFPCFTAGDERVNEQIQLTIMHTIWMRFHNVIARELKRLNPYWDDETLYQEARRIVNAMYQHIVYNEWLPIILGKDIMVEKGLLPLRYGYSNLYDPSIDPTIANEFATVAFRFGHTLVQGMLDLVGKRGSRRETVDLVTQFNNPSLLYTPGKLDDFLRGIAQQPPQQSDNFVTTALTNRLFQEEGQNFGMDLVALNTQRGRDHAIGTYNDLRELAGLPRATTFDDFRDVLPNRVVEAFSRLYASVDDVDPFVAGIAEENVPGSILGPTFRAIIADQFCRLRQGDRFFYDQGGSPTSFTEAQLHQIRQISFARVLCATGDNIMTIQPLAMRAASELNPRLSCRDKTIPPIDLTPWLSSRGSYH
ncbi:peroxidase-like [Portunus trituberculatus]|uniref:peroxidase-like n=1 Tax=Portunus trituberculatus TaxID=210409 RepID=UPI001E1D1A65|nr:peroxidase-like [Portunus trituberculatus]